MTLDKAVSLLNFIDSKLRRISIGGDIFISYLLRRTPFEVENYFFRPWRSILSSTGNPRSFTLAGNHGMYSGGAGYYSLLDKLAQPASYFCLRNKYWQIIGLDTGLKAKLGLGPTNLEQTEAEWLVNKIVNRDGRKTALLSHHQLFSADEKFDGQSFNIPLYKQVASLLGQVDIWLWGREHNLVIFDSYMNLRRGRCIGCGAFPVGKEELPSVHPTSGGGPTPERCVRLPRTRTSEQRIANHAERARDTHAPVSPNTSRS
jgi:hypothetical protein